MHRGALIVEIAGASSSSTCEPLGPDWQDKTAKADPRSNREERHTRRAECWCGEGVPAPGIASARSSRPNWAVSLSLASAARFIAASHSSSSSSTATHASQNSGCDPLWFFCLPSMPLDAIEPLGISTLTGTGSSLGFGGGGNGMVRLVGGEATSALRGKR